MHGHEEVDVSLLQSTGSCTPYIINTLIALILLGVMSYLV
jgi:hypothetical protein